MRDRSRMTVDPRTRARPGQRMGCFTDQEDIPRTKREAPRAVRRVAQGTASYLEPLGRWTCI